MFNAPSMTRIATCIAGCALALLLSSAARSQTIDVSLNVFYDIPSDVNSGGNWELVAKSSSDNFGIAGLQVRLTNINPGAVREGPRGNVNGSDPAGFSMFDHFANNTLFMYQEPAFPTGVQEEGIFYGVGRIENGEPGDIGWTLNTLSNPQDIPWATGDTLVVGPSEWDIAARLASGTFPDNFTPGFATSGHAGSVFTNVGSATLAGDSVTAMLTTTVRTNFMEAPLLPDYNNNGVVDAADYVLWRKGSPAADGNGDMVVDVEDYELWREHFGAIVGGDGAGSGFSGASVPEPASCVLLVFGLLPGLLARRR